MIKLYTSPTCGICKMIKMKLNAKQIEFEESQDIDFLIERGVQTLPAMEMEDGTLLTSPLEMNNWINSQEG